MKKAEHQEHQIKQADLKKDQRGRTMVETISVIAIMGLITIVFIISYRYAINRWRSYVIISRLTEMATGASVQMMMRNDFSLDEFKSDGDTYPYIQGTYPVMVEKNYAGKNKYFALSVSGIPQMVCNFIVRYDWKLPSETKVNEGGSCQDLEDGNTIMFAFDADLVGGNSGVTPSPTTPAGCPNISYDTCMSKGYICTCSESDASRCRTVILKSCTETPTYYYTY